MKNTITKLSHADVAVGVLTGLPIAVFGCFAFGAIGAVLGTVAVFLAACGSRRQRAALQLRIDVPAPLYWQVVINKVRVGLISDRDYACLEKAVHEDWRMYCAQGRNLIKVGMRAALSLVLATPVALIGVGLVLLFLDPDRAAAVADGLRSAPSREIVAAMGRYTSSAMIVLGLVMCLYALLASPRLGYENVFEVAIGEALRSRIQTAANGRLELIPCQPPVRVIAN